MTVEITVKTSVVNVQPLSTQRGVIGLTGVGLPLISLTQLEFDAIAVKDPNTLYDITDA